MSLKYLKITAIIVFTFSITRLIPHPPNFTNIIAISFYFTYIFGRKSVPIIFLSFVISDLMFFGSHQFIFFTWLSILIISFIGILFKRYNFIKIYGSLVSSIIFFLITNLGVWYASGMYDFSINGILTCYIAALPFFGQTLISTLLWSGIIESLVFYLNKFKFNVYKDLSLDRIKY